MEMWSVCDFLLWCLWAQHNRCKFNMIVLLWLRNIQSARTGLSHWGSGYRIESFLSRHCVGPLIKYIEVLGGGKLVYYANVLFTWPESNIIKDGKTYNYAAEIQTCHFDCPSVRRPEPNSGTRTFSMSTLAVVFCFLNQEDGFVVDQMDC